MIMFVDSVCALHGLVCTRFRVGALVRVPWHPLMSWKHAADPNNSKSDIEYEDAPMRHLAVVGKVDKERRRVLCVECFDGTARDVKNSKQVAAKIIQERASWLPASGHCNRTAWFAMEDCETYHDTNDCVTFAEGDKVGLRVDYLPYAGHDLDVKKNPRFTMNRKYHGLCLSFIVYDF